MLKKIIYSLAVVTFITALTAGIIAYGRGYRLNPWEKSLDSTGILSASSSPDGASIFIDNKLKAATNGSFSLPPGWYSLRISKTGYQSWEKRIKVQGEVVTDVDALLIPSNPSLRALTTSGVLAPALSPSHTRVAYIAHNEKTNALWLFELKNGPLGGVSDPKEIYQPLETDRYNYSIIWSPDEKNLAIAAKNKDDKTGKIVFALEIFLDDPTTPATAVTSALNNILNNWQNLAVQKQKQDYAALPIPLTDFLNSGTQNPVSAPDSNKILYLATSSAVLAPIITPPAIGTNSTSEVRSVERGKYYVYDVKEDKNFYIADQKSLASKPIWYTDSKRIVIIEKTSILIMDYDGTNKRTVYSGPFEQNTVYPWTSMGKLVILTNLNQPEALPNLYEVDIR